MVPDDDGATGCRISDGRVRARLSKSIRKAGCAHSLQRELLPVTDKGANDAAGGEELRKSHCLELFIRPSMDRLNSGQVDPKSRASVSSAVPGRQFQRHSERDSDSEQTPEHRRLRC